MSEVDPNKPFETVDEVIRRFDESWSSSRNCDYRLNISIQTCRSTLDLSGKSIQLFYNEKDIYEQE
jgi:hypothetical protein